MAIAQAVDPSVDIAALNQQQAEVKAAAENAGRDSEDSGDDADAEDGEEAHGDEDASDTSGSLDTETDSDSATDHSISSETSVETKAGWEHLQRIKAERRVRFSSLIGSIKRKFDEIDEEAGSSTEKPEAVSIFQPLSTITKPMEKKDDASDSDSENEREMRIFEDSLIIYSDQEDAPMPDFEHPPILPKKSVAEVAMEEADVSDLVDFADEQPEEEEQSQLRIDDDEQAENVPAAAAVVQMQVVIEQQEEEPRSGELQVGQLTPVRSPILDNRGIFPLNPFVPSIFIKSA
ncbi:uncharacterized protein LOC129588607 [Paramacrobiotus metropolitanus]|uniref:uncharacterized protein LOC129588607 n=1 Tax=Paramacrobiotus metropolitanus TaxID=2943436 RepID=UPI0024462933|nr:uncharacterized protein LOC129588607 [Paramacrobiotus metropolitanus]